MHIIKPDNLGLFFRTLPREGGFALAVSAYACFPLTRDKGDQLLFEADMWKELAKAFGENDIFDPGFPKPRAEFLLYGRCFPQKETTGMEVGVRVGNLLKTLQVMGQRYWQGNHCTAPEILNPVRLDWSQAYGSPDFPVNPLGKGHTKEKKPEKLAAPTLLRPGELLSSVQQEHEPVSFTAIPPFWPQRAKNLGKFDDRWKVEDWPYLPRSSKAEFYCTAPSDQRFDGFFQGTEIIEIQGAHPQLSTIRCALPGLRARLFAQRSQCDRECFAEIPNLTDTLWLLPEQEIGIVCYRGVLQGVDEDATDVLHVLADWEPLQSDPRPVEYYHQVLLDSLKSPLDEEPEPEPEPKPAPEAPPEPAPAQAEPTPPPAALEKMVGEAEAAFKKMLGKLKLTEADIEKQLAKSAPPATAATPQALEAEIAGIEAQLQKLLAARGLTTADVDRVLAEKGKTPSLAQLSADMDKQLASGKLTAEQTEAMKTMKQAFKTLEELPPVQEPKTPEPEAEPGTVDGQEEAPQEAAPEQKAAKADYHGQALVGADFRDAVLENADFSDAILHGADFQGAILTNANFSGADLTDARLGEVEANGANFSNARFIATDLRHGNFSQCDFSNACFHRADLDNADCSSCNLLQAELHFSRAKRTSFQGANLTDVNFYGSLLERTAFGDAVMHHVSITECLADGAEFYGVNGTGICIRRTSMVKSRADKHTRLEKIMLNNVNMTQARWAGANVKNAHFWNILLNGADFSNALLENNTMSRVQGKRVNLLRAEIISPRLRRVNLFKSSLRKAKLVNGRAMLANLYGVDLYGLHLKNSHAENSNLKRTLWEKVAKNA